MGFGHEFADDLPTLEDDALTGSGDMGKEAMLNRIVLGAVGRIVGDANFDADVIGQCLQVLFEDVVTGAIAAAAITENQD